MAEIEDPERPFPRPLSEAKVANLPSALVPARTALTGRSVSWNPLTRRGTRVICSRRRMETRPRFESETTCRWGLGTPRRRSTRGSCASKPRGTSKSTMPFVGRHEQMTPGRHEELTPRIDPSRCRPKGVLCRTSDSVQALCGLGIRGGRRCWSRKKFRQYCGLASWGGVPNGFLGNSGSAAIQ
jgi:hypothetical protein